MFYKYFTQLTRLVRSFQKRLVFENSKMKTKLLYCLVIFSVIFISKTYAEKIEEGDCPSEIAEKCSDYCCGLKGNVCCNEKEYYEQFPSLEDSKAEPRSLFKAIGKLIAFVVGAVIFVIVVCCVCCFCCPFCLFSKHRNGRVIRRNDQAQNQEQQGLQQQQQQPQQIIQTVPMHPNPPTGYPPQQAYPNQAYPPAPQPGYGYPQPGQSNVMPYPDN